jgi:hypothetical protein
MVSATGTAAIGSIWRLIKNLRTGQFRAVKIVARLTLWLRASSSSVAPSARRLTASFCCAGVREGGRPMAFPWALARLLPSAVRVHGARAADAA